MFSCYNGACVVAVCSGAVPEFSEEEGGATVENKLKTCELRRRKIVIARYNLAFDAIISSGRHYSILLFEDKIVLNTFSL